MSHRRSGAPVKPNSKVEIGDFWLTDLGPLGPVDVNLPPDDEPKNMGMRRKCGPMYICRPCVFKRREKALKLIKKYGGLYEAEAAPEWVIKCIMNIDKFYWKQLERTIAEVETLRNDLKVIKSDAGQPLREALQKVEDLTRVEKDNEELRATLAVAEATAAAATAELLQTRSGLTKLQSSRAMSTHRLAESVAAARSPGPPPPRLRPQLPASRSQQPPLFLTPLWRPSLACPPTPQARREVRLKRRDGLQSALELARTRARNKQLEAETEELALQLESMGLQAEQQRALFNAKVADLRDEVKPKRKKCQWCGPRVCPIPVVKAKKQQRPTSA